MVLLLILNSVVDIAVDIILVSGSDFDFAISIIYLLLLLLRGAVEVSLEEND